MCLVHQDEHVVGGIEHVQPFQRRVERVLELLDGGQDGAAGLARIKARGGVAIVQDPSGAERRAMPDAAIAATVADAILPLGEIGKFLYGLCVRPAAVRT